jgi:hypothetical protein
VHQVGDQTKLYYDARSVNHQEGRCLFCEQRQFCIDNEDIGTVRDNSSGLYFTLLATSEITWSKVVEMLFQKHRNPLPGTAHPGCRLDILINLLKPSGFFTYYQI